MASVSKGVVVKVVSRGDNAHSFEVGEHVTSMGEDFGPHHQGVWARFKNEEGETQYLLPEHFEVVEAPKAVEKKVVVEVPAILVEESPAEVGIEEILPNKVVYGVLNAEDEIYATTADRDFARELKSALGGKRKGVRIFQYAAVKEIR